MGEKKKATDCYLIAAKLSPKDTSLWNSLVTWSIEQGNSGQALYCLSKAIAADPADVTLLYREASLYKEEGNYLKAAGSNDQIVQIHRNDVEALKRAATAERSCGSGEFPLYLISRKGICHAHLADMEKAEICFSLLEKGNAEHQVDLIIAVANSFVELQKHESALKYYLMLEGCASYNGIASLKIADCFLALKKAASAIEFYYKGVVITALGAHEDDIETRLILASLLFEENREDEAIKLLSPPPNPGLSEDKNAGNPESWWLNSKVKLKLSQIYKSQGMVEAFVGVIYPLVHESLKIDSMHEKRKKLSRSELLERVEVLDDYQTDSVFGHFRRPGSKNDALKANRAKKLLEKRTSAKHENASAAMDS